MEFKKSSFWCQIVPAKQNVLLKAPIDSNVTITNAVIPEINNNSDKVPCRLFAKVQTLIFDGDDIEDDDANCVYQTSEILLTSLIPFSIENQELNTLFTPLNIVEFKNTGNFDIHLSGYILPLEDSDDEFYNLEEEDKIEPANEENISEEMTSEPLTADIIQNRLRKMVQEMGPRTFTRRNSKKHKKRRSSNESKE